MPQAEKPTSAEAGAAMAGSIVAFHAELVKKGITPELAEKLTLSVAGALSSWFDGHCDTLARPDPLR